MIKQIQAIAKLCQTILHWRLENSEHLGLHLKDIHKKVRSMRQNNTYEEAFVQMLVSKQSFQIKQKILKAFEQEPIQQQKITIQIQIIATRKRTGQIYNEQLWQFGINFDKGNYQRKINSTQGIVYLIEHVLKNLQCSSLLPLNQQQKNKFIIDYKVSLTKSDGNPSPFHFENMSSLQTVIAKDDGMSHWRLAFKFCYNSKKIDQGLKEMIMEKSFQKNRQNNKSSTDSTQESIRYSFHEYYDDQFDITVLSNEQIKVDEDDSETNEFQLLIEETISQDQLFLNDNLNLFQNIKLITEL